ncbi:MAG: glutathione S-transferase family protein [Rhodospirillaceae bacterium]|nr:glutathione S-transferase family protein [Rhodospirillaceae bacterium]
MALTFYYGSGSSYAWKVWLTLEHKEIPYEFKLLSFDRNETRSPEFLKLNPRGKVPTIVDNGFAIWESSAIAEYLEERYPQKSLLPGDAKQRANARRLVAEADSYVARFMGKLSDLTIYRAEPGSRSEIEPVQKEILEELMLLEAQVGEPYLLGDLSLADFTLYPHLRIFRRIEERHPGNGIADNRIPAKLRAWMKRIEALPYFEKTLPPHWKG